jgi:hypothetical protein
MRKKLVAWEQSFDAFDDLVELRRAYYEPLLPGVDTEFRKLDARMRLRLEQRKHVAQRLQHLLIAPRPEHLATADEQSMSAQLDRLEARLAESGADEEARLRIRRLRGALTWSLETNYHERLTQAHQHLRELSQDVDALNAQYAAFVRSRQAATHSYAHYEAPIRNLRSRVAQAKARLEQTMTRQGHVLEMVARQELKLRHDRLEAYQNQARFAFADSYDRAAKAQAGK